MKKFLVAMMGLMVLSAGSAFAQRTTDDSRQRELYRQAMDLYGKQKYAAAQQIFDEIALGTKDRADLTTADACYFAGVCSEKLDNNDASYRLEEFLRLYPQSSRCNMARFYLGNFWYTRGSYDVALIYYKQVALESPEPGLGRPGIFMEVLLHKEFAVGRQDGGKTCRYDVRGYDQGDVLSTFHVSPIS